jgi:hypothetical protein|tara:strand:- start:2571 stop:3398 length:828 start_codon:yes stop_codon:yes gene_type:complete
MTDADGTSVPTENESADIEIQTEPTGATSEATETEATEPSGEDHAEAEEEKTKKRNSFQERINQKTQQVREAELRAKEANERAQMFEERLNQDLPEQGNFPQLEDFDYDQNAYQQAVVQFNAHLNQRTVQQAMSQQEKLQVEHLRRQANQAAVDSFKLRSEAFASEHPDFMQKISSPGFKQGQAMQQAIILSDNGPALALHLAQNPQKTAAINSMAPGLAMMELGRLSQALTPSRPVLTSQAPPPAKSVKATGRVDKDPDKMSPQEYSRYRGYSK